MVGAGHIERRAVARPPGNQTGWWGDAVGGALGKRLREGNNHKDTDGKYTSTVYSRYDAALCRTISWRVHSDLLFQSERCPQPKESSPRINVDLTIREISATCG